MTQMIYKQGIERMSAKDRSSFITQQLDILAKSEPYVDLVAFDIALENDARMNLGDKISDSRTARVYRRAQENEFHEMVYDLRRKFSDQIASQNLKNMGFKDIIGMVDRYMNTCDGTRMKRTVYGLAQSRGECVDPILTNAKDMQKEYQGEIDDSNWMDYIKRTFKCMRKPLKFNKEGLLAA